MAENKMSEVAKLFGKELGEEFKIKLGKSIMKVKFTEKGFMTTDFAGKWWLCSYLSGLLIGEVEIVE